MAEYAVNPLFLYVAIWGSATFLYVAGQYAGVFPASLPRVLWAVLLNVGTFTLGYLTWSLFRRLPSEDVPLAVSDPPLTERRLRRSLNLTLALGAIVLALCAIRLIIIAGTYKIGLFELVSDPDLLRRKLVLYVGASVGETQMTSILISISNSIFSIGFVLLGIHCYLDNGKRRYLYTLLFLALSISIGILNLNRKEVMVNILFLVFSYLLMHSIHHTRTTVEVTRSLFLPMGFLVLLFVLIDILLAKSQAYQIPNRYAAFLFSLYWYIASPLAAFNEFMGDFNGHHLLGQSLFFPLHKWLHRFGLVSPTSLAVFSEKVYLPYVANVYSYLRNIYEDFGMLGVAVVPYVLGWGVSALRQKARVCFSHFNLYLILLVLITFSFYNYLLMSNQFYLQALFGWLFFRYDLRAIGRYNPQ